MAIKEAIKTLVGGEDLSFDTVKKATFELMEGKAPDSIVAGFLVGLSSKGETSEELLAVSEALLEKAVSPEIPGQGVLDTCGTGGDHSGTFNISTAAAFVCAACGVKVVKHGNRSLSSVSGSADVLEALGAKIELNPERAREVFEKTGLTFLFAPVYHPAMKSVARVRRELGVRTVFNIVGPVVNPSLPDFRILGVSSKEHARKVAEVLRKIGVRRAFVYSSENGLDEISLDSRVYVLKVEGSTVEEFYLDHSDFGLEKNDHNEVKVSNPQESARAISSVFKGEKSPHYSYVIASAAAGIYVSGAARSLRGAVEMAKQAISSGKAYEVLVKFVEATGGKPLFS